MKTPYTKYNVNDKVQIHPACSLADYRCAKGTITGLPSSNKTTRKGYARRGEDGYAVRFDPPHKTSNGQTTVMTFFEWELLPLN